MTAKETLEKCEEIYSKHLENKDNLKLLFSSIHEITNLITSTFPEEEEFVDILHCDCNRGEYESDEHIGHLMDLVDELKEKL